MVAVTLVVELVEVRCRCAALICRAAPGSVIHHVCPKCGFVTIWKGK